MLLISLISWGGVLEKPITQSWWRGKLNGKLWSMLCVLKKPWLLAISPTSDTYWVLVAMIVSWKILSRHTFHLYHKNWKDNLNVLMHPFCFWTYKDTNKNLKFVHVFSQNPRGGAVSAELFFPVCARVQFLGGFPQKISQPGTGVLYFMPGSKVYIWIL